MAGSIQKVNNRFRITKELGKDSNGKRLREYAYASTEAEAKKLLAEFEYNLQRNLLVQSSDINLLEFLEHWMDNYVKYNCEETTAYGYRNIVYKHIAPFLGDIPLQKLQPKHIQQYYKHLIDEKKLSPNTVHKHHASLRKALDYGLKQQYVYRNVADAVSLPKRKRFEGKSYTKEQLSLLLEKVRDTKLELPVKLCVFLGLRREEVCGLKWEWVDLQNRTLKIQEVRTVAGKHVIVKPPKTEKSRRTLFVEDELYDILLKTQKRQKELKQLLGKDYEDSGYVFTRDDGKPYRVNSVTERFKEFLENNNLPRLRLHDLRHSFASILYDEGVDLLAISQALGHSDLSTTSRVYLHTFDKNHKNTVSAMSSALRINK
ncbi:site-specific integrase [Paenibacillus oryzisoli]|uniref:site-specific integrase n=1 Tax=Paenibacillus oryzisoli TaxID=1850517 RepID=UPI003D2AC696